MDAAAPRIPSLLGTIALLACAAVPLTGWPGRVAATLRDGGLNTRDGDRIERGYYERLTHIDLRSADRPPRADAPFDAGVLATPVPDVREYVLRPNLGATHKGATWTTNALGMRDAPLDPVKPPGTLRIGLVGDSIACGWGVDDGRGFEPVVQRIWDERASRDGDGGRGGRVEVCNFAVPGHAPGQRWEHFRWIGWPTEPDLVIVESTLADLGWDERRLRVLLPRGVGLDAPVYREALREAGIVAPIGPDGSLKARLRPHREAILAGVYRRIVADCRARGVPVVWVLVPRVGKPIDPASHATLIALARSVGFDRIADVSNAFDGLPARRLAIAPDDFHPNVEGHAILARRIDEALGEFVSSRRPESRPTGGGVAPGADLVVAPGAPSPAQRQWPEPAGADPR